MEYLPVGMLKGHEWLDDDGHSPLFYAVLRGYVDVVVVLLEKWKNVDLLDDGMCCQAETKIGPVTLCSRSLARFG